MHAELMRKHADVAAKEGGIYFSGEYMTMLADMAESIEAENAKLRELVAENVHELSRARELMRKLRGGLMSDLLAKCDWHGDELRVELPQWPEVVTVWVNGKAMPYVPVVNDSKCDTCEAMLDCDECLRADASHKELRGLQAETKALRELVRFIMHQCNDGNPRCDECIDWNDGECVALLRMREMGVEVDG